MARFSDDMINRIKNEVSLIRLVESSGVELKPHGKDFIGRCPFHNDKTPSLVVSPETNLWHCLGACQIGGSVIDWVIKTQGVSFRSMGSESFDFLSLSHLGSFFTGRSVYSGAV